VILHTLNGAPGSTAFSDCARLLCPEDALLLLGDGVYAALAGTAAYKDLCNTGASLYLLEPDGAAAGILGEVGDNVSPINFDAFVGLTERYAKQQAWY
jgi:tRNA 2-thiouridine synthesizing protein B